MTPLAEQRVRDSFGRQAFMATMGASIAVVRPGEVVIELPFATGNTQQHGLVHGGAVASIADFGLRIRGAVGDAGGCRSADERIQDQFPRAGKGERLRAVGRVVRPGRRLVVCLGEVFAVENGQEKQVALLTATMAVVETTSGLRD